MNIKIILEGTESINRYFFPNTSIERVQILKRGINKIKMKKIYKIMLAVAIVVAVFTALLTPSTR